MIGRIFFLAMALGALSFTSAFAQSRDALGRFKDWDAYKLNNEGQTACYAVSKPKEMIPKSAKRDAVYFLITHWPARSVSAEPSIQIGYPYRPGSEATVTVGGASFKFFTKDDGAWLSDAAEEKKLVSTMRQGSTMVIKGTSTRGTITTDRYSLAGLSAALDKIEAACK